MSNFLLRACWWKWRSVYEYVWVCVHVYDCDMNLILISVFCMCRIGRRISSFSEINNFDKKKEKINCSTCTPFCVSFQNTIYFCHLFHSNFFHIEPISSQRYGWMFECFVRVCSRLPACVPECYQSFIAS